jgi:hypothetical protein
LYTFTYAARAASYQTTSGADDAFDAVETLADEPPAVPATTTATAATQPPSQTARSLRLLDDFMRVILLSLNKS